MESSRIPPQGIGFTTNELVQQPVETLSGYDNPRTSLKERRNNSARGIELDVPLTPGEEEYFASGGSSIRKMFEETGRDVAPDGTFGFRTLDGRIVSGEDYAGGFCAGDIVQLKSGGPRMTVLSRSHLYRQVACDWFVGGERKEDNFDPCTIRYLGRAEDLPPEVSVRVLSLQDHREALLARANRSIARKARRIRSAPVKRAA